MFAKYANVFRSKRFQEAVVIAILYVLVEAGILQNPLVEVVVLAIQSVLGVSIAVETVDKHGRK